jgi:dTDP-4-amino-4,6-dideoxygalactose transaminase
MLPRIRPYFDNAYIETVNRFNVEIKRDRYKSELSKNLSKYYPNAKKIEFFDQGRNSLWIALDLLNLKRGDEILIPCFTCPGVLDPIIYKGLKPILIEIGFDFKMNLTQIKDKISKRTKAILVTHFFGIPANILEIKEIAIKYEIAIIEDCAHTFCSRVDGLSLGSIGDLAFTSFQNDKPLSLGKGSMLIVNNDTFLDRFETVIGNVVPNSLDDEQCAFLSLLFFNKKLDSSAYTKFIGADEYYFYFKKRGSVAKSILERINNDVFELADFTNLERADRKDAFNSIFKKILNYHKADVPTMPLLMNRFSLNLLNASINCISHINEILTRNGNIYINNLKISEQFMPVFAKDVPYLRYPLIFMNTKFWKNAKTFLIRNGYEVGNFNWNTSINTILNIKGNYNNCEFISANILNLPSHTYVKEEEIIDICNKLNNIFK